MTDMKARLAILAVLVAGLFMSGATLAQRQAPTVQVFKTPTCGCCANWVAHLQQHARLPAPAGFLALQPAVEEAVDFRVDGEAGVTEIAIRGALDLIAQNIERHGISCQFKRTPWFLVAEDKEFADVISKELEAAKKSGLPAEKVNDLSAGIPVHSAIKVENQAQFNPLFYVKQLAQQAEKAGAMIFENSAVTDQKKEGAFHKLSVGNFTVTAQEVVSATHIPKGILPVQSMLGPYREHGIAFQPEFADVTRG